MADFINPQEFYGQTPEMIDIARKQRMAQMLMQQSQMPQGQMISGHYVAPNPAQMLASALGQYKGLSSIKSADEQAKQIAQGLQQQRQTWMGEMPRATPNTSDQGPVVPQQPSAEDYTSWAMRGMQIDPKAAAMGMQSANLAMNREAQAAARRQAQENFQAQMQQRSDLAAMTDERMREIAAMRQQQGQNPYFQALPTEQGYMRFNARTGQMEPLSAAGQQVLPAAQSPSLQGQIAASKETGKVTGKETTEAALDLPRVVQQSQYTIGLVDDLLKHPGFKQAVGTSRMLGVQKIPGTSAYDFDTRLRQLTGQQFMQAYQTLKGGGQITEIEGKKATDAISRMDAASSEEAFKSAAREFQDIIRKGVERAQMKAGGVTSGQTQGMPGATGNFAPQGNVKFLGFE